VSRLPTRGARGRQHRGRWPGDDRRADLGIPSLILTPSPAASCGGDFSAGGQVMQDIVAAIVAAVLAIVVGMQIGGDT